ncbi:heme-binding protein [Brevundimonas sp. AJA228-03]|uniref:SOUL family heme-binding protein n=1 Tax=Brevundimonas sp. AJA228-03 TaxID=2752515 RepID=UPI001AE0A708|nr:heme-binding protein [Brevundimonas sp. AJA228-03]QTN19196.1 heme-binding protein [Brevundimonas sp. AJA228-03]
MRKTLMAIGAALVTTACSTVGVRSGTEEPAYQTLAPAGDLEIRLYGERIAAQTVVTGTSDAARNQGFRRLAGYIFGGNARRASIAMTAPVAQSGGRSAGSQTIAMTAPVAQTPSGPDRWTVQFFMPAAYTMDQLPVPDDPTVELVVVPAETYAVVRFSGVGSVRAVETHKAGLMAGLSGSGWVARDEPVVWFYDPPWTLPPMRRNEVAVRVERE